MNNKTVEGMYERLRSIPAGTWERLPAETKRALLKGQADPEIASVGYGLLHKIALQVDRATFVNVVVAGDIPPLKLSAQEMELVSGGKFGDWLKEKIAGAIQTAGRVYEELSDFANGQACK